ncbi:hypothetical protein OH76DRAFT_1472212 [Lentinus brumalis]|uniref:BTB domain-containing protein n=1 Tax=Lentinus brumalis TaxID=2498619 RepID=A0A371D929_9APHY|nr:hypothetical protein OH76DRAFT_1472212 [Polyporus brumalis]
MAQETLHHRIRLVVHPGELSFRRGFFSCGGVVNIARLTQNPTILPTALVVCCDALCSRSLLFGVEREDGTLEILDDDDLVRCVSAKRELIRASTKAVLAAFAPFDPPGCEHFGACQQEILKLLRPYFVENLEVITREHLFSPWESLVDDGLLGQVSICDECVEHLAERVRSEQMKVWERLPEILDLGEIEGWPSGPDPDDVSFRLTSSSRPDNHQSDISPGPAAAISLDPVAFAVPSLTHGSAANQYSLALFPSLNTTRP